MPALCPPEVSRLVLGMLAADPDAIESFAPRGTRLLLRQRRRPGQRDAGRHQEGGVHPAGERGDAVIPALAGHWI